ncbi:hypothetical protein ACFY3O_05245 [Streptomyces sp. NPDC001046]
MTRRSYGPPRTDRKGAPGDVRAPRATAGAAGPLTTARIRAGCRAVRAIG